VRRRPRALAAAAAVAGAIAAALAVPRPAAAHDFWLAPESFTPAAGAVLGVGLRVGEGFVGEPVARNPQRIVRFALVDLAGETGESAAAGLPGWEPAGRVRPSGPGLHAVVYESRFAAIALEAEKFTAYLREEGLEAVIAARAAAGAGAEPGRERYARSAKALLAVRPAGGAAPAPAAADRPLGLPLELVAQGDPTRLAPGAELAVRLRFRGEPLAGALVVALSPPPRVRQAARSDAAGRVRFRLDRAGPWLVKAVHMVPAAGGEPAADWESHWASLTFAVPAD
jgi:hypothetical protein